MPARLTHAPTGPFTWPQRLGLVNRRASAFMLEMVPIQLVTSVACGPVIARAIEHYDPWTRAYGEQIGAQTSLIVGAVINLVWFALRDTVPGLSWGKRMLGLTVVRGANRESASLLQRATRNLPFVVPMFMLVEGIVALATGPSGRRSGDWISGTRVVARDSQDSLNWRDRDGAILCIAALLYVGAIVAGRYITEGVFNWSRSGEFHW